MMSPKSWKLCTLHKCSQYGFFHQRLRQFHFVAVQPYYFVDLDQEVKKRKYSSLTTHKRKTDLWNFKRLKCEHCQLYRIQERSYADIVQGMATIGYTCFTTMHHLAPWWLSIVLVTIPIRTGVQLIKEFISRRNDERVAQVNIFLKQWSEDYRKKMKHMPESLKKDDKLNEIELEGVIKEWRKRLYEKNKCHHYKSPVVSMLHLPVWFSLSLSIREMSGQGIFNIEPRPEYYQPSLETEGCLWFPDMVLPDAYAILPIISGLSMLSSIEISVLRQMSLNVDGIKEPRSVKVLRGALRLLCVLLMTVGASLPSCLTFYWCLSSLTANIVTLTLLNPTVLKKLNMRVPPGISQTPYRDIYNSMKIRYVKNPVNLFSSTNKKLSQLVGKGSKSKQKDDL